VSNIIVKHRHGLVTDCHRLLIVPMVPQSAPMVSVAMYRSSSRKNWS